MTVKELMGYLSEQRPDKQITIYVYEGQHDDGLYSDELNISEDTKDSKICIHGFSKKGEKE